MVSYRQSVKGKYKEGDTLKFETKSIKSHLCDYSHAFILVTENITVTANSNTDVWTKITTFFKRRVSIIL